MFFKTESPFADSRRRFEAGRFGVWLFLASLAMLFAATIIGFIVIRLQTEDWPARLPSLPATMWISTLVLIASSATMQAALLKVRADDQPPFRAMMMWTTVLGLAFLFLQGYSWWYWYAGLDGSLVQRSEEYRFAAVGFYVLTGVHAMHVIGGLIPMCVVTLRAMSGRYSSTHYPGVQYCAMYWHFLDAVWVVLFVVLLVGA